jgi:hypothetical protein
MKTEEFEDVLRFWFPSLPSHDPAARVRQLDWWFRGGGDAEISDRFTPLLGTVRTATSFECATIDS